MTDEEADALLTVWVDSSRAELRATVRSIGQVLEQRQRAAVESVVKGIVESMRRVARDAPPHTVPTVTALADAIEETWTGVGS